REDGDQLNLRNSPLCVPQQMSATDLTPLVANNLLIRTSTPLRSSVNALPDKCHCFENSVSGTFGSRSQQSWTSAASISSSSGRQAQNNSASSSSAVTCIGRLRRLLPLAAFALLPS